MTVNFIKKSPVASSPAAPATPPTPPTPPAPFPPVAPAAPNKVQTKKDKDPLVTGPVPDVTPPAQKPVAVSKKTVTEEVVQEVIPASVLPPSVKITDETQNLVNVLNKNNQQNIDRVLEIEKTLAVINARALLKEQDGLMKTLRSVVEVVPVDEEVNFKSPYGRLVFSVCANKTEVTDRDAMINALTPDIFKQIAKVTMGDLDKYLSKKEILSFSKIEQNGSRVAKPILN